MNIYEKKLKELGYTSLDDAFIKDIRKVRIFIYCDSAIKDFGIAPIDGLIKEESIFGNLIQALQIMEDDLKIIKKLDINKMKVYKVMFNGLIVDVFDTYEEASEECDIRNYEYANETAYLGEYDYHRYYIQEDNYENL